MARIDNQTQSTWSGLGKVKKKGLIARWRSAAQKICNNVLESDRIPTKIVRNRNFTVHDPDNSRTKYKEAVGVISYTDGSVFKNKTGCGVHTVHGKIVWCKKRFPSVKHSQSAKFGGSQANQGRFLTTSF